MKKIIAAAEKKINPPGGEAPLFKLFQENLPVRPYCTDELGLLFIQPVRTAIKRRYIQQNSPWDLKWLVYDVDRPTAHFDWYDLHAPAPNMTAMNPENGHAHLFYGLEVPVIKAPENLKVHPGPLRYAASIDIALTRLLEADLGYAGLICKNPLHNYWDIRIWEKYVYDLDLLADYLDLESFEDKRKYLPPIGLGRNCTLFDATRHWAYRQIRKGSFFNEEFFIYEVTQYAAERNAEFPVPLPYTEVKATGKSVGKWTYRHMSPEGFKAWADNRRKKSIIVRKAKRMDRTEDIKKYKMEHPEASNRAIAKVFDVSEITIRRAIPNFDVCTDKSPLAVMVRKIAEYSAACNYSIREIAEILDVSKSTVQRIMKEY